MNQPIIQLRSISKAFGRRQVLAGVDLDIHRGQTTVILGESGTGKSVLLKTIVGLIPPDTGSVHFDGRDITRMSERELAPVRIHFGFLFQGGALFDSMTAGENVAFPLRQHTLLSDAESRAVAHEKLRLVGLDSVFDQMPASLSGGQKKRVSLARSIAMEPQVVLYDEPTTGLDPIRSDVINELILLLQRKLNVTGIVVTHDMNSAFKVADRILMLYQGRFIFDGTADELRNHPDDHIQRFIAGRAEREELESLGITPDG